MLKKLFKITMLIIVSILLIAGIEVFTTPINAFAINKTYYVDSVKGSDSNNGTSSNTPWASLTKVNSKIYSEGDKILFKAGGIWTGQLYAKGSGINGAPIVIDMYGTGNKPIIQGNGTKHNTIYFYNQSYWEINNLEVTNKASDYGDYRGISVNGDDYGVINHIYIKNCDIHDVNGEVRWISGSKADENGIYYGTGWDASKRTGGIVFDMQNTSTTHVKTTFNDILVQGCKIKDCSFGGIIVKQIDNGTSWGVRKSAGDSNWTPHTNVTIKDNYISQYGSDHACNGIYMTDVKGGTIKNNVVAGAGTCGIEMYYCDSITCEKNETFDTTQKAGGADSNGIDPDKGTTNIIVQNNYVHDNGDGILLCEFGFGSSTIRYNILQNNKKLALNLHSDSKATADIYNNILYTNIASSELVNSSGGQTTMNKGTYKIRNNIFYSAVSGPAISTGTKVTYDYNCYYGVSAPSSDGHAIIADPQLVKPGSGKDGGPVGTAFSSLSGYKLKSTSPCINKGISIWSGGKDFWGNTLYNSSADIGANEYR
ncbi:right-handed parallel beta-helix repeat-containing protein [Clostridium sp. SHJSY1]|uniref:right-handed parallel beta-helix repeat-containing protein n=1 Tax=Clostridium sp. SHJSY1 TaxID=2942483 RepID=UPI00287BA69D|nr:right-handed parallel beta-helix repeat-containing protein [Clostridium sp. SHJSY1]